jgi:glycosyltransferase involved in cell wall biosynthesis
MDIVHFGKFYWPQKGGMETALRSLAEFGTELGHQVECVVNDRTYEFPFEEDVGNVQVMRYPARARIFSAPLSFRYLRHRLYNVDVLHVHIPNPIAELTTLWTLRKKQPLLVPFLHALPVNQKWLGEVWFRLVTRRILDRAHVILVSNENATTAFPQLLPWKDKLQVLPFSTPAITDEHFTLISAKRATTHKALAIGRLVPYKGFDVLLRAWKLAIERAPRVELYELNIIGEGPQEAKLKALVIELGLEGLVFIRGACSDREREVFMEEASLLLAPSLNRSETFGISILEAMGHGLPVITSDLDTGVRILSRNGECGCAVPPG